MKLIGTLSLLLLAIDTHASDQLPACVPLEGLTVGGISLSDSSASVMAKLGRPKSTGTYQSEDDGGIYTGSTLIYSHLELDLDKLRGIERIASIGPNTPLPFGLKVGMALPEVGTLLHFVPVGLGNNSVAVLPACDAEVDTEMRIHFHDNTLQRVEIEQHGP